MEQGDFENELLADVDPGLPAVVRITSTQDCHTWKDNLHLHDDEVELHFIKQGETTVTIHRTAFAVKTGDLIVIEPGTLHLLDNDYHSQAYIHTFRLQFARANTSHSPYIVRPDICPVASSGECYSLILKLMESLEEISQSGMAEHAQASNLIGAALAVIYCRIFAKSTEPFSPPKPTLGFDIVNYINQHYDREITLASIAEHFFISTSHVSNVFKREFGISPINYIINRRLCEAKWQLLNSRRPIQEIARLVGYENSYHFSKIFVKRLGMSPEKFREMHGNP